MSLPKTALIKDPLSRQKLESLLLPALVGFILVGIVIASFLIPKENKKTEDSRDTSAFTASNKVEVQKGKVLEVAPVVKQISPETLQASILSKEDIVIVHVFQGENWQEPYIEGSKLIRDTEFDVAPNFDKEKNYVYVSSDGYDSAKAIAKLLQYGFSYDKNVNLEGGIKAWKEKDYEVTQ